MKVFLTILILTICFFSCRNTNTNLTNGNSVIHLDIPVGQLQQMTMSNIISEFKAVKLEFTDQSMIGDIRKIIIHNGLIYVLDTFGAKSLMVFNFEGKFIRKIGSLGKGPGQYILPKDFIINENTNEIEIIDNQKINFFSSNGKYIKDYKIKFASVDFTKLGDNYFFAADGLEDHLIFKTDNNFKVLEKFIPVPPKSVLGNAYKPFMRKDELHFLFRPLVSDTIYSISREKVVPSRIVEFGKHRLDYDNYLATPTMEKVTLVSKRFFLKHL